MTEETMLTKAAKALHAGFLGDPSLTIWEYLDEKELGFWLGLAKAALEAIREASQKAYNEAWDESVSNECCTPEIVWSAMIDAILQERA